MTLYQSVARATKEPFERDQDACFTSCVLGNEMHSPSNCEP